MRAGLLLAAVALPLVLAATSPLLQWRDPIYILAGFAGIFAMGLLAVQPVLAAGYLGRTRRLHRALGSVLIVAVVLHIAGLWITSPPDVIDVLLFRSPTPFALWGVIAVWALFGAALLAAMRRRLRPRTWRRAHAALTLTAVLGTAAHALLIEGTMETLSKFLLAILIILLTVKAIWDLKIR